MWASSLAVAAADSKQVADAGPYAPCDVRGGGIQHWTSEGLVGMGSLQHTHTLPWSELKLVLGTYRLAYACSVAVGGDCCYIGCCVKERANRHWT